MNRALAILLALFLLVPITAACGSSDSSEPRPTPTGSPAQTSNPSPQDAKKVTLRLGYFPNLTHAQPIVGIALGTFTSTLGPNVQLETKAFNAGPAAIEALFAGEIDAAYIGPNPAINGYVKSNGRALRIVAGSASGGVQFVVRSDSGITSPKDLAGKKIATPQLGNTQDVALRAYLIANGLAPREQGGNVTVIPTSNPETINLFKKREIDGAWVPEPWATRLVKEAGGRVFLDERDLWPNRDFVITHLIVSTKFLEANPQVVENLIRAHVEVTEWINENPQEAQRIVNAGILQTTGAQLPADVLTEAWTHLRFTYDPIASSLKKSASDAFRLGYLADKEPDLSGIYDLTLLNKILKANGLPPVSE
ncbi:MAG: lipoprotein [Fimbriimonadales bacterium]|nr:MAG: lipoprotein [Fimbriimonadales bacterium]